MMTGVPFISESDQAKLSDHFRAQLTGDVRLCLTAHAGECEPCRQARELLAELTSLSERLSVVHARGDGALPEIRLEGSARGEVRFVGLPTGYEFPGLIESIVDVSRGSTSLTPETLVRLDALDRRVRVQVFTTPT